MRKTIGVSVVTLLSTLGLFSFWVYLLSPTTEEQSENIFLYLSIVLLWTASSVWLFVDVDKTRAFIDRFDQWLHN